jgi:PTS system mannose-specific IIC component
MHNFTLVQVILVSLWAAFCICDLKTFKIAMFARPLLAGFGAGIILGNLSLGLVVGATLELMALGVWNYGGAPVPDYTAGSIIGVAIGTATGKGFAASIAAAIPVALLFVYFDILAMTVNTLLQHRSDKYAENGNVNGLNKMHKWGFLVWGLSRAVPVFLGVWFGPAIANSIFAYIPKWLFEGIGVAGKLFPALGIGMLLKMLPIKKYYAYLIMGFVLAAYLKFSFIAITLIGISVISMFALAKNESSPSKTTNS